MSPFIFAKLILPYRERREQTMSLFVFAKLILPDLLFLRNLFYLT